MNWAVGSHFLVPPNAKNALILSSSSVWKACRRKQICWRFVSSTRTSHKLRVRGDQEEVWRKARAGFFLVRSIFLHHSMCSSEKNFDVSHASSAHSGLPYFKDQILASRDTPFHFDPTSSSSRQAAPTDTRDASSALTP